MDVRGISRASFSEAYEDDFSISENLENNRVFSDADEQRIIEILQNPSLGNEGYDNGQLEELEWKVDEHFYPHIAGCDRYNDLPEKLSAQGLLHVLAKIGKPLNREKLQILLDHGADINKRVFDPEQGVELTPIHAAVLSGDLNLVDTLLEYGTDLDQPDNKGFGLLPDAYSNCGSEEDALKLTKDLLERGASPDQKSREEDIHGGSLLHLACFAGDKRLAKLMLKHSASPNFQNSRGQTPLHIAVYHVEEAGSDEDREEAIEIIEQLKNYDADPTIVDHDGMSPLLYAEEEDLQDIVDLLRAD